jgi:hypothetical protein
MTAEKIHAGVNLALEPISPGGAGIPEVRFINPDETAVPTIERCLAGEVYDCLELTQVSASCHPVGWVFSKRWSTPSTVPRRERPSPSTPALKIAVPQPRAESDTCSNAVTSVRR